MLVSSSWLTNDLCVLVGVSSIIKKQAVSIFTEGLVSEGRAGVCVSCSCKLLICCHGNDTRVAQYTEGLFKWINVCLG